MPDEDFKRTDLTTIANGAIVEQFQEQLLRVMANVDDLNTEAKAARKITIEVDFLPDASRQSMQVKTHLKTKLASPKKSESLIFVVRDRTGEVFAVDNNVHQPELFKG